MDQLNIRPHYIIIIKIDHKHMSNHITFQASLNSPEEMLYAVEILYIYKQ